MTESAKSHPLTNILILGTLLGGTALFITMPYLAIHITSSLGASPSTAGLVIGIGPLFGMFAALLMGYLSDRFGRRAIMEFSLLFLSLSFLGFLFSKKIWHFVFFNTIYGMSRAAFDSVATALLTDITPQHLRKKVFHLRYFMINLAASIAPLIGAWILIKHPTWGFTITSAVYFMYFIVLHFSMDKWKIPKAAYDRASLTIKGTLQILKNDRPLLLYLIGNFLMLLGFSQLESNLPLYLKQMFDMDGIKLYSYLIMTNGLTIVILQYAINSWTQHMNQIRVICLGFLVFGCGVISFGFFEQMPMMFILSMIIFSIGEILVFSNANLLIDQISPANLKGSYFGILEIGRMGYVFGPYLGGLIIQYASGPTMFVSLGLLSFISIFFYKYGDTIYQKKKAA
jgi:MFS family permease